MFKKKNTIEWKAIRQVHNQYKNDPDLVNVFLEKGDRRNNKWWKDLPTFRRGFKKHLEYVNDSFKRYWNGEIPQAAVETGYTAKVCPAIRDGLLDKMYKVKMPYDFYISVTETQEYAVSSFDNIFNIQITSHPSEQFNVNSNSPFTGMMNIKFEMPIFVKTDKIPYMFLQPQYEIQDFPFMVMNGVVEGKYCAGQQMNINTLIKIPEEPTTYFLPKGTVIAYMWFPEKMDLVHNPNLNQSPAKNWVSKDDYNY